MPKGKQGPEPFRPLPRVRGVEPEKLSGLLGRAKKTTAGVARAIAGAAPAVRYSSPALQKRKRQQSAAEATQSLRDLKASVITDAAVELPREVLTHNYAPVAAISSVAGVKTITSVDDALKAFTFATDAVIARAGDLAHDIGENIVQGLTVMGQSYPSMRDYYLSTMAPAEKSRFTAQLQQFLQNEQNIRAAFQQFHPALIPRRIRSQPALATLTTELQGLGCNFIVIDAQFGNLFTQGFGTGMTLLNHITTQIDGASKALSDDSRGGVLLANRTAQTFSVPFFWKNSLHIMKQIGGHNVIHIQPDLASQNFSVSCESGFSVNAVCSLAGLQDCRGTGVAAKPIYLHAEQATRPATMGNNIVSIKTITDWAQLVYILSLQSQGTPAALITNDFFCFMLAISLGVQVAIRTPSTAANYVEVYISDAIFNLTAAEQAAIDTQVATCRADADKAALLAPITAELARLQAAILADAARLNVPATLQAFVSGTFQQIEADIAAQLNTIQTVAGRAPSPADYASLRGLATTTIADHIDAVLMERLIAFKNTMDNFLKKLRLRVSQVISYNNTWGVDFVITNLISHVVAFGLTSQEILNSLPLLGPYAINRAQEDQLQAAFTRELGTRYNPVRTVWDYANGSWLATLEAKVGETQPMEGGAITDPIERAAAIQSELPKPSVSAVLYELLENTPTDFDEQLMYIFGVLTAIHTDMEETNMNPYYDTDFTEFQLMLLEVEAGKRAPAEVSQFVMRMLSDRVYGEVFWNVFRRTTDQNDAQRFVSVLQTVSAEKEPKEMEGLFGMCVEYWSYMTEENPLPPAPRSVVENLKQAALNREARRLAGVEAVPYVPPGVTGARMHTGPLSQRSQVVGANYARKLGEPGGTTPAYVMAGTQPTRVRQPGGARSRRQSRRHHRARTTQRKKSLRLGRRRTIRHRK